MFCVLLRRYLPELLEPESELVPEPEVLVLVELLPELLPDGDVALSWPALGLVLLVAL